jgi:formate C-acetyltransferase
MGPNNVFQWIEFLRDEAVSRPPASGEPAPVREGLALAHALRHLPIRLHEHALLVGRVAPETDDGDLQERFEHWIKTRTPEAGEDDCWSALSRDFQSRPSDGGYAHTTVDYPRILKEGMAGIVDRIRRESQDAEPEKRDYLRGMELSLNALVGFAERFAMLADDMSEQTPGPESQRLQAIATRCRRVPRHPARTFCDALQAVWFVHLGIAFSERSGASLSLGRMDQYLLPFFERDRQGGMSRDELGEWLAAFFRLLNGFGDPASAVNLGPAMAVNLGGESAESDRFNDLSRLIVETVKRLRLPAPLLAARIHPDIPRETFDVLLAPDLVAMGQPSFYGEQPCRAALKQRGVPEDELDEWAVNSCMGLMMPGQEWSNMWGAVVNLLLPLELASNGGKPFWHKCPVSFRTVPPPPGADFDAMFDAVCGYADELAEMLIQETARRTERRGHERPNPFVSSLLDDCIERGRDRLLGGCRYHTVIVEAFGLVNAADALTAVRELAFEQSRFALEEMVEAAKRDFADRPDILQAIRDVPKYGNGHPVADEMVGRLADRFSKAVRRHSTEHIAYCPSFHTLSLHIGAGAGCCASLDGRRAGEPLAKNVGTSPGRAVQGPTALLSSAAVIDQAAFAGGQALDLSLDLRMLRDVETRRKFQDLLQTYFSLGGLQVQLNGVSPETLRAAFQNPGDHRHVLVRKAGYTARYVTLGRDEQLELIERFESGL